jgi:hypothetical protein
MLVDVSVVVAVEITMLVDFSVDAEISVVDVSVVSFFWGTKMPHCVLATLDVQLSPALAQTQPLNGSSTFTMTKSGLQR